MPPANICSFAIVGFTDVEPLQTQLARDPRPFPKFRFKRQVDNIDGFKYEDFELIGYKPHKRVKMKMAV